MKKIYVQAYCQKNLGDDLFVLTLAKRYPKFRFDIPVANSNSTAFKNIKNIKCIKGIRWLIGRILNKYRITRILFNIILKLKYHAFINIGGSIFIEAKSWKQKQENSIYPRYLIGANFGPYQTQEYFLAVKEELKKYQDVCFRDSYSCNLFQDLENVRYAPDVLFGYNDIMAKTYTQGIGISVIALEKRKDLFEMKDQYYKTIADLCDLLIEKQVKVTLFSFCAFEGDNCAIQQILNRVKIKEKIRICSYNGDTEHFLGCFNECETIIATRFHAMILGWTLNKKVFPIIYSKKQLNVINDVKFKGVYWNLLEKVECYAQDIFWQVNNGEQRLVDIENIRNNSHMQFSAVDNFLTNSIYER